MTSQQQSILYTLMTILFWGGAATAFKTALQQLSPLALLWHAVLISLAIILLITFQNGTLKQVRLLSLTQWGYLLLLGSINPFLYYVILFEAYDRLPGQVAMSLNYLWPVMLAILSVPILHHRLGARGFFAILLSFTGSSLIATRGNPFAWASLDLTGIALALVSTLVWAVYWLLSARIRIDAEIKLLVGFISGSLLALGYAFLQYQTAIDYSNFPWLAVIYVGLFEMGITFFIWLKALQLADNAARIGNLIYLTPFLSLLLLALFLDESIHLSTLAGLLLIITGILFQRNDRNR